MGLDDLKIRNQPTMFSKSSDIYLFSLINNCILRQLEKQEKIENFEKLFTIINDINGIRQARGFQVLLTHDEQKVKQIITDLKNIESDFYLVQKNYHEAQNQSIVDSVISAIRTISNYAFIEVEDFDENMVRAELNKYEEIFRLHTTISQLYRICLQGILAPEITNLIDEILEIKVGFNPNGFYSFD